MGFSTRAGRIGQWRQVIDVVPTITAGAYSLNDALGGRMTFALAGHGAGESGVVEALRLVDRAQQQVPLDLYLFDQPFTAVADNAVFDLNDPDVDNAIGVLHLLPEHYTNALTNSLALLTRIDLPYVVVGSDNLYGQLVIRGGPPTYVATSDIRVRLTVRKD